MSSTSIYRHSGMTLEFDLNKNIDAAAGEVQAAINAAGPLLPKDVARAADLHQGQSRRLSRSLRSRITSDAYDIPEIYQFRRYRDCREGVAGRGRRQSLSQRLAKAGGSRASQSAPTRGHACVDRGGEGALEQASISMPKGEISDGPHRGDHGGQRPTADTRPTYQDIVVKSQGRQPVKLQDVANVFDSTVNDEQAGWFDDERSGRAFGREDARRQRRPDRRRHHEAASAVRAWAPASIKMHVLYDRTLLIRASIADVSTPSRSQSSWSSWWWRCSCGGSGRRSSRASPYRCRSPLTLGVMYLLGFSLDNISLMAVTIAIGFVIDNAIIMIENIIRLMSDGETPINAAVKGHPADGVHHHLDHRRADRRAYPSAVHAGYRRPVVSRVRIDAGGGHHRFSAGIADTDADAVRSAAHGRCARTRRLIGRICERAIDRCIAWYARSLDWTLRRRWLGLTFAAVLAAGSVVLVRQSRPRDFCQLKTPAYCGFARSAGSNISFEAKQTSQHAIATEIRSDPAVADLVSYIGRGTMSGGRDAGEPQAAGRAQGVARQVIARLRKKLAQDRGLRVRSSCRSRTSVSAPKGPLRAINMPCRGSIAMKWCAGRN